VFLYCGVVEIFAAVTLCYFSPQIYVFPAFVGFLGVTLGTNAVCHFRQHVLSNNQCCCLPAAAIAAHCILQPLLAVLSLAACCAGIYIIVADCGKCDSETVGFVIAGIVCAGVLFLPASLSWAWSGRLRVLVEVHPDCGDPDKIREHLAHFGEGLNGQPLQLPPTAAAIALHNAMIAARNGGNANEINISSGINNPLSVAPVTDDDGVVISQQDLQQRDAFAAHERARAVLMMMNHILASPTPRVPQPQPQPLPQQPLPVEGVIVHAPPPAFSTAAFAPIGYVVTDHDHE
jgi:hypothetical protein